ncbi:MAG: hypothetical protein M1831_003210 [Alyxoria varia]|nr:MAG: hypothetical protein M1831_003210 [Alyxoria varia]
MAPTQPYIYAPPSAANDGFDPKAHTRASLVPPRPRKPKQEGPLLDFNKHPDSYLILPYGQTDAKPLPPTTKRNVKWGRWVQLGLRVLGLIAAVGMLVAVICITNIQGNEGWIIRAAPAVDILITTYAIYHLSRAAKGRTPASSASYHIFAIVMDICLIPFYVFIALADRSHLEEPPHKEDRWKSFFKNIEATRKLLQYTWVISVSTGGIHLIAIGLSFYLFIMFRKISNLPPDMNPLEDNLTSRRKAKHKHKSSEVISNKHDSAISMSAGRDSPTKESEMSDRPLSFFQTRMGGSPVYSPHNPTTANISRNNLQVAPSLYTQSDSARTSRMDLNARPSSIIRAGSPARSVQAAKTDSLTHSPSLSASTGYSENFRDPYPPLPRKSSKRHSGPFTSTENWYSIGDDSDDDAENRPPEIPSVEEEPEESSIMETAPYKNSPSKSMLFPHSRPYELVRQISQPSILESDVGVASSYDSRYAPTPPPEESKKQSALDKIELHPLAMNPPTPPPPAVNLMDSSPNSRSGTPRGGVLQDVSGNERSNESGTPTKRYYGDLHSAMHSIRKISRNENSNEPGYGMSDWIRGTSKRVTQKSNLVSPYVRNDLPSQKNYSAMDGKGRVVSRSGADLGDPASYMDDTHGQYEDRRVSGKIAEEGRGGGWARRRISGRDI